MKAAVLLATLLPVVTATTAAFGDDNVACADAAFKGQASRSEHKLVEAREQLRVCVQTACPALIQSDCARWLAEVETALPTVVLTAKDDAGHSVFDVKVSERGILLASKLEGESLPLDPGLHLLHFETGGLTVEQQVPVKEGEKNQGVVVVFKSTPTAAASKAIPWRTVGWVTGALGVVSLGVGAGFGVKAIADKSSAHCDPTGACDAVPLSDLKTSSTISTAFFVAGSVLVATGGALVLFGPRPASSSAPSSARLNVVPLVSGRDAGLMLAGGW